MTNADKSRDHNKKYYEDTYTEKKFVDPKSWPQWKLINNYVRGKCLEIGCGTHPKVPVEGNYFLDISTRAVESLKKLGAHAEVSDLCRKLPYKAEYFDFVSAFELLEHLPNDCEVIKELHRVLKKDGICAISVPLHQSWFNKYDEIVGHQRRYEPELFDVFFRKYGFRIIRFAKIDIMHANNFFAAFYPVAYKYLPGIYLKLTNIFEGIRFVNLIGRKMEMQNWDKSSPESLLTYCNTLLILKKI
jgi:SAM-dependent methyltransferase